MSKRILADMSATLLHHGHIRVLQEASKLGKVIVALTTDEEVERHKGYVPELDYTARKEILEAIRYVDEVIPSPWVITDSFLDEHDIDLLIHGGASGNKVVAKRVLTLPRTPEVSSSDLRKKIRESRESE